MAITKTLTADKIETLEDGQVQVRTATVIKEDGTEISVAFRRHVIHPSEITIDNSDGSYIHTATDISSEPTETQAVCNAVWTNAVKAAWKTLPEENRSE